MATSGGTTALPDSTGGNVSPSPVEAGVSTGGRRGLLTSIVVNGGARVAAAAAPVVTVPFIVRGLGRTGYGEYVLASAFAAMLPIVALGLSTGLVTGVAQANARGDNNEVRRLTSSSFALLSTIALAGLLGAALSLHTHILASAFGVSTAQTEFDQTGALLLAVYSISLPATVSFSLLLGLHRSTVMALWQAAPLPIVVISTVLVARFHATLLPIVACVYGPPAAAAVLSAVWVFGFARPDLRPRLGLVSAPAARSVLGLGLAFSAGSLAGTIGYQTDSVVLSHLRGLADVATYGASYRVSGVLMLVGQGLCLPLWPRFAALTAEGRTGDALRLLKGSTMVAAVAAVVFLVAFVSAGGPVVAAWAGPHLRPSTSLLVSLGLWASIQIINLPMATYLVAVGARRFIAVTLLVGAAANVALSIVLTNLVGISGPAIGSAVSVLAFTGAPSVVWLRRRGRISAEFDRAAASVSLPLDS